MQYDFDLIILGSGPAGFSCSMQASKFDKTVLIVEASEKYLGGAWINYGTVPSKALRDAASIIHKFTTQFGDLENKKAYQIFQMQDLLKAKTKVIDHENSEIKRNLIKNDIKTIRGYGCLTDDHTVEVTDFLNIKKQYTAEKILIATGGTPTPPSTFHVDHKRVLDNTSILKLHHIPRRLIIVGAGVQAIEYATSFAALGTKVTILNSDAGILQYLDEEIKNVLVENLNLLRITVYNNVSIQKVDDNPLRNCTEVHYTTIDDEYRVIETEQVLYFGGRSPNSANIGLEEAGVKTDENGFIKVDQHYKTSAESIYAAGDVIGYPQLASASFSQGRLAACDMFDIPALAMASEMPLGIYSIPEISSIGLTEKEATDRGYQVTVGRAYWNNLTKAAISNSMSGVLKLVFETDSLKLLGVHIIGQGASEIIHIGQSVIAYNGDIRYFINHMLNYPTFAEAYRIAAFNGINRVYKAGAKYRNIIQDSPA